MPFSECRRKFGKEKLRDGRTGGGLSHHLIPGPQVTSLTRHTQEARSVEGHKDWQESLAYDVTLKEEADSSRAPWYPQRDKYRNGMRTRRDEIVSQLYTSVSLCGTVSGGQSSFLKQPEKGACSQQHPGPPG